jgi:hypothetical protein
VAACRLTMLTPEFCLSHKPFSPVHSIAQALGLAPATIHRHLTAFLDTQPPHFRWVVRVLTRKLRDQRVKGSQALFDVLRQQQKAHFRDGITGNESRIFIDTTSSSIWSSLDEELPARRTISAGKPTLIAFWGIKVLVQVNWLPTDGRINAVYFRDEILIPISQTLQTNASGGHRPWT